MKGRPRSVEREVAKHLSSFFATLGMGPVVRIPVLGRTGPDISIGELGLVVDVKSRIEVPKGIFPERGQLALYGDLCGWCLADFNHVFKLSDAPFPTSVQVTKWHAHMDEWTRKFYPLGISCIIAHRPKMPLGSAVVIIQHSNLEKLWTTFSKSTPQ